MSSFRTQNLLIPEIDKAPDAVLDYEFDWAAWLVSDRIITATITATDGITVDRHIDSDTTVTVWLSGGLIGSVYEVTCHIVTEDEREDDRSFKVICKKT